jgi:hypothetical protein
MSQLSGIKDVDREILNKLDDRSLLKACRIDKYTWNTVCDDAFLRRRLLDKYPEIETWKIVGESWKHFFLRAIRYIALLKEEFSYEYTFGNFVTQYYLLKKYDNNKNKLLFESSKIGELALVIRSLKSGANIYGYYDDALGLASQKGHLEIVKYLVENVGNIHFKDNALKMASENGHLETVKYLVEAGADIHAENDRALKFAKINRHLEIVKYLESKM